MYLYTLKQTFTEASQHDLMLTLNALEQQGWVSSIHSLWSANALYFTTTEDVMLGKTPSLATIVTTLVSASSVLMFALLS